MKRIMTFALTAVTFTVAAFAQAGGPPPGGPGGPHGGFRHGGPFGPEMHPWKVVTDAPYSAAFTDQSVQTLGNGSTVTHSVTGTVARDASGRTYVSQTFTGGPLGSQGPKTVIFITDPVAGVAYTLYPDKNEAVQRPFKAPPANAGNHQGHTPKENPNVVVNKATGGSYQNLANIESTTITRTVPANTEGNSTALHSTSVVQYSPELQVVVSSSRTDDRFGTSTYALSNIVPGAPNVSFAVPSGYTVKQESAHGRGQSAPPPPPQQ